MHIQSWTNRIRTFQHVKIHFFIFYETTIRQKHETLSQMLFFKADVQNVRH